jgi:hypothetical protein
MSNNTFIQLKKGVPFEVTSYDQTITITALQATEKKIILNFFPAFPEKIKLTPAGGIQQVYGIDYTISNGNELTWASLGLDGFIEEGEVVFVSYLP